MPRPTAGATSAPQPVEAQTAAATPDVAARPVIRDAVVDPHPADTPWTLELWMFEGWSDSEFAIVVDAHGHGRVHAHYGLERLGVWAFEVEPDAVVALHAQVLATKPPAQSEEGSCGTDGPAELLRVREGDDVRTIRGVNFCTLQDVERWEPVVQELLGYAGMGTTTWWHWLACDAAMYGGRDFRRAPLDEPRRLAAFLREHPDMRVRLHAYDPDLALAESRARAASDALEREGVSPTRIARYAHLPPMTFDGRPPGDLETEIHRDDCRAPAP